MRVHLALDESNHGSDPEVIAAIFSIRPEDAQVKRYDNKKKLNAKVLENFFKDPGRLWKTLIIPRKKIIRHVHPLLQATPKIVNRFIGYNLGFDYELDIQLDGCINHLDALENVLRKNPYIPSFQIRQFPKVKEEDGCFNYTPLLQVADTLASKTYRDKYKKCSVIKPVMRETALFYKNPKKATLVDRVN